ncbi:MULTISPECIES: SMI1/KNR4 family protein [unclassified Nocardioides]|uniref:SMI1/KNR4 family protein n=1 Tax=unclassified Nocardioides TaxID=2615069 RepID=UPI003015487B
MGDDLLHRWQDVVELTRQERFDGGLPGRLVALHPDGGGSFTCLDGERVVLWVHDEPGTYPVAQTFSEWLPAVLDRS